MDERREMDPAARRAPTTSGTPTATRGSSTVSSCSSNSNPTSASASTGTPPPTIVPWAGGAGDSYYYPGCRKDANCACEMCLASINATRDLILAPETASARRFFAGAAARDRRPALFCRDRDAATPGSAVTEPWTPPMRSTAKSRRHGRAAEAAARGGRGKRGGLHDWALYAATVLGFLILLWVDTGLVPEAAARGFGPKLSPEAVAWVGAEARLAPGGLDNKLRVLEQRVGHLVGGEMVANCSSQDSVWQFHQDDQHVFHWRCTVYKSAAEEVSVWGSPLRTSGLLPATLSPRHLTLLAGKITEWSDGRVWPTVRASNGSSWGYRRHSAAAVRLEPETWVLEYQRSALFEGTRLIPAAAELLSSRCSTMARRARRRLARRRLSGGAQANPT